MTNCYSTETCEKIKTPYVTFVVVDCCKINTRINHTITITYHWHKVSVTNPYVRQPICFHTDPLIAWERRNTNLYQALDGDLYLWNMNWRFSIRLGHHVWVNIPDDYNYTKKWLHAWTMLQIITPVDIRYDTSVARVTNKHMIVFLFQYKLHISIV